MPMQCITTYSALLKVSAFSGGDKLNDIIRNPSVLVETKNYAKEMEAHLLFLQSFMGDIYEHSSSGTLRTWLENVKRVAQMAENIMDGFEFAVAKNEVTRGLFKRTCRYSRWKSAYVLTLNNNCKHVEEHLRSLIDMIDRFAIATAKKRAIHSFHLSSNQVALPTYDGESCVIGRSKEKDKLIQMLSSTDQELQIVSIYGMGGVGKTLLASSVYNMPEIQSEFKCHAWLAISQNFEVSTILRELGKQILDNNVVEGCETEKSGERYLMKLINNVLVNKKYLIVLDDVWTEDSWSFLGNILPINSLSSRVIITTRNHYVASLTSHFLIRLNVLSDDEAWNLLCMRSRLKFEDQKLPSDIMSVARGIVKKCEGLPLALVVLSQHLNNVSIAGKSLNSWKDAITWEATDNREICNITNVLKLSYWDLPFHLKSCFLYLSFFPEGYIIDRIVLIQLWIAEGFVELKHAHRTLEDVAEEYLDELVSRSLVQVMDADVYGRGERFKMHTVIRGMCLGISREERFGNTLVNLNVGKRENSLRRLSIHASIGNSNTKRLPESMDSFFFWCKEPCGSDVHSTWIHSSLQDSKMLRVLILQCSGVEKLPDCVYQLYNLHYLDLSYTKVRRIGRALKNLQRLQTLHLIYTKIVRLPDSVTTLRKLRHLAFGPINVGQCRIFGPISAIPLKGNLTGLQNLQTLGNIQADYHIVSNLRSLSRLRNLSLTNVQQRFVPVLWPSLAQLESLTTLGIIASSENEVLSFDALPNLEELYLTSKLQEFSNFVFRGYRKLTTLRMGWCGHEEDPLQAISHVISLVELRLCRAFEGRLLTFRKGWFPNLRRLSLLDMHELDQIEIEAGSMESLKGLGLTGLGSLTAVPSGIKNLLSLEEMFLNNMPGAFMESLYGSDQGIIQHIPQISIT